jgi:tripartite-type tricarboxylate transporter receptor subunit TctC
MNATTRRIFAAAAALFAVGIGTPASAQGDYPNRVVRVVVGFAAGGGNDIFARLVGQKLSEILGQSVIIENKPGAGARLANEYVLTQPADGYTLLVAASGGMSIASAIYPKLGYHPTRNFVPLTMIANFPLILAIQADHPARTVQDLVAYMKANPDKSNYATSSPSFTIATELFKLKTGAPGQSIPYKSSGESLVSVLSGQTLLTIADGPPTVPMVKGGKIRALAVTG